MSIFSRISLAALLAASLSVPAMAQVQAPATPAAPVAAQPTTGVATPAPAPSVAKSHRLHAVRVTPSKASPAALKTAQPAPAPATTISH